MIVGPKRSSTLPVVTGPIANRTIPPSAINGAAVPFMSRKAHFAMQNITTLQLEFANWGGITEANNGATIAITASIEYPANTFTQVKFSGSATGSIGPGVTLTADVTSIVIPAFAQFWSRFFQVSTGMVVFNGSHPKALNLGDADTSNGTDQTMGGTVVDNTGSNGLWPVGLIGPTSQTTLMFCGDSKVVGQQPFANSTSGFVGNMEPSFAPNFAFMNLGMGGETASGFLVNSTKRRALMQNGIWVIVGLGVNDASAGQTGAQIYSNLVSIKALFPGQRVGILTIEPHSTSTNQFSSPTGSDQTAVSTSSAIDAANVLIAANSGGFDVVFDTGPAARLSSSPDLWFAAGPANLATFDGLHPSEFTNNRYGFVLPP